MSNYIRHLPFDQRVSPELQEEVPRTFVPQIARILTQEATAPPASDNQALYLSLFHSNIPTTPEPAAHLTSWEHATLGLGALGRTPSQTANFLETTTLQVKADQHLLAAKLGATSIHTSILAAFRQRLWLPQKELYDPRSNEPLVPRLDYLTARASRVSLDSKDTAALQMLADGATYPSIESTLGDPRSNFQNTRLPLLMWRMGARTASHLVRIAAEAGIIRTTALPDSERPHSSDLVAIELLSVGYERAELGAILGIGQAGVKSRINRAASALKAANRCRAVSVAHAAGYFGQLHEGP
jgi:DNA-binding NarL/FixJ family response regulator